MRQITARDIMPDLLVTIRQTASLIEAVQLMLHMDIGSLLVVDDEGRLSGIVTDSDFSSKRSGIPFASPQVLGRMLANENVEQIYAEARSRKVEEIMSHPVETIEEDTSVDEVLRVMFDKRIRHLPVVRDGKPVGIVTSRDLLQLMLQEMPE